MSEKEIALKDESWKCELVDSILEPCKGLQKAIADYYRKSNCKGIISSDIMNMKTEEMRTELIIKSGEFKNGITMNFCPFCGKMIQTYDMELYNK